MNKAFTVSVLLLLSAAAVGSEDRDADFANLFRASTFSTIAIAPNGQLIAYIDDMKIMVGKPRVVYSEISVLPDDIDVIDIIWIGANTLWIEALSKNDDPIYVTVEFSDDGKDGFVLDRYFAFDDAVFLVDPDVENETRAVVAKPRYEDELFVAELYAIDAFRSVQDQLISENRIDTGSDQFFLYGQDTAGNYVLGIRIAEGTPEIWRRSPGDSAWVHVWTADRESSFMPVALSPDYNTMWVLTNAYTDRTVAAEFSLGTNTFGNILYEHDRVDVKNILMSADGSRPVGVTYVEGGLLRYEFFSEESIAGLDSLQERFAGSGIITLDYSEETSMHVIAEVSPTQPGLVQVCNTAEDWCEVVASMAPWLDSSQLSETTALEVESTDGITVEAFLTLPTTGDVDIPLVALPHGGPLGISDYRYFSPEVQWLASNGYAVLQVNYRGSGGYGQAFKQAGLREWGRGIEDDIEAAVRKVLEDHPKVDANRVGIFGSSYGGYSALMSVIRNPDLFKCAASFAGVTDLSLMFSESAARKSDRLREILVSYVGDPSIDRNEQMEHSPVYRYRDIHRPILLAHGLDDDIVDYEHTWRMQKMLRLAGQPPELVLLDGTGHGFRLIKDAKALYDPLIAFLDQHLKPDIDN